MLYFCNENIHQKVRGLVLWLLLICISIGEIHSQTLWVDSVFTYFPEQKGIFVHDRLQKYGFYSNINKVKKNHSKLHFDKSLAKGEADFVDFVPNKKYIKNFDRLTFKVGTNQLNFQHLKDGILRVHLPKSDKNYTVIADFDNDSITQLKVEILEYRMQIINIIYFTYVDLNRDSIQTYLDRIFKSTNVHFEINISSAPKDLFFRKNEKLENPNMSRLRYNSQMIEIRDNYLSKIKIERDGLLFFVIPRFKDSLINGFMVKDKAMGFLTANNQRPLREILAEEYLNGFINLSSTVDTLHHNFMFSNKQWIEINQTPDVFSYIDDYEDVVTNNGLIAYYLFEEDGKGNIIIKNHDFFASVLRPLKKNTYSYHLQIDNVFYKTIFKILKRPFNITHVLSVMLVVILLPTLFYKLRKWIRQKIKFHRFIRFILIFVEMIVIGLSIWLVLLLVDQGYYWFEVKKGKIENYHNLNEQAVIRKIASNVNPKKLEEKNLGSELIIKKKNDYYLQKSKNVLYFNVLLDDKNQPIRIRLIESSDTLHTRILPHPILAQSHYMILKIYSENGVWLRDELYNHLGVNLTEKVNLENPPKRILLFVNGYRPTSLGSTFEENFNDIKKNGLEFPNSYNRIYTSDRYNYWHPWGKIDDSFKERINPSETYYADGHYSVSTSNYRSILKFTTTSQRYPKRCKDPKHHVCYRTKLIDLGFLGTIYQSTYRLLPTQPNKVGFEERENGGRIAGRNLQQLLNELPNNSNNDTLYIVAHSMGFAYAEGIIEQLRGLIQFGGLYIIAPEDAEEGKINPNEWKEVWQYGSNLGMKYQDAPCLQDGIAPQTAVVGIGNRRVFIPGDHYYKKGFFDSHFIGYYKWILQIQKDKKGHIHQN